MKPMTLSKSLSTFVATLCSLSATGSNALIVPQSSPSHQCRVAQCCSKTLSPTRLTASRVGSMFPLEAKSSAETEEDEPTSKPPALGALNFATVVGSGTAIAIIWRVANSEAPRLFKQHVMGAAVATLMVLPAAVGAVRSRFQSVDAMRNEPAKNRRGALLTHVYAHFYLTYAVAAMVAFSLGSIFVHKARMGKAHFSSVHSRVGLLAVMLWTASYLVAQWKVWMPMLKRREFKYSPNLLWASNLHKRLGCAASALSLGAAATGVGISSWGRSNFSPAGMAIVFVGLMMVEAYLLLPPIREELRKRARRRARNS